MIASLVERAEKVIAFLKKNFFLGHRYLCLQTTEGYLCWSIGNFLKVQVLAWYLFMIINNHVSFLFISG